MSKSTEPGVLTSVDDGVATIVLNNVKSGNALTRSIYLALCEAWQLVERDPDIRVAIFTASGEKHFCTGADVSSLSATVPLRMPGEATGEGWRLTWRMAGVTKPVLVVVNGTVAGGGLGFVTDGDIVFASSNATFRDTHVAIGQICGYGALRLVSIIGASEAKRVALAGGVLTAERAHQLGLVNEVYDTPAEALAAAREAARSIVSASPPAVYNTHQLLVSLSHPQGEAAAVAQADRMIDDHKTHPDSVEGTDAWLQRRVPEWVPLSTAEAMVANDQVGGGNGKL